MMLGTTRWCTVSADYHGSSWVYDSGEGAGGMARMAGVVYRSDVSSSEVITRTSLTRESVRHS